MVSLKVNESLAEVTPQRRRLRDDQFCPGIIAQQCEGLSLAAVSYSHIFLITNMLDFADPDGVLRHPG